MIRCVSAIVILIVSAVTALADEPDQRFPFFQYLTGQPVATMITYTPSQLDPRQEVNQRRLATSSIRADLEALRPAFDGLILYGYHEACTPRIVALAKELKYRAVLLARVDGTPQVWAFHGVGFEAFDLPWKSEESKLAIEKLWGLLSPKREPYPAFQVWRAIREQ